MSPRGWKKLAEGCSFRGPGHYPIAAYSEFMPPVRLGCRPYGGKTDGFFLKRTSMGSRLRSLKSITNYVRDWKYRSPGTGDPDSPGQGDAIEHLAKNNLVNNPYWPPELAKTGKTLHHERFVFDPATCPIDTQDDKGRRRWTFFGGSEQGPLRSFWKSFFTSPGREIPSERAMDFIRTILSAAYGGHSEKWTDLHRPGFAFLPRMEIRHKKLRPAWASSFLWTGGCH